MHMLVVILMVGTAVAQFIAHSIATVFERMNKVVLAKEGQTTGNTRLVHREQGIFQFKKRHRTTSPVKRFSHEDAVSRRANAVVV